MKIIPDGDDAPRALLRAWRDGESATVVPRKPGARTRLDLDACRSYAGEPALVTWTSGTTAKHRKGVVIPWRVVAARCAASFALYGGRERLAVTMSLRGQATGSLMPLAMGCEVVPPAGNDLDETVRRIADCGVTTVFVTPGHCDLLLKTGRVPNAPALRQLVVAGAFMSARAHARYAEAFGVPVINVYGATETGTMAMSDGRGVALRAIAGVRFRQVGGLLQVRTPYLAARWLHTDFPMDGPWYRLGDSGAIASGVIGVGERCAAKASDSARGAA